MTVSSTNRKAGPYVCDGTTSAFPFSFKVFSASDLRVVKTDLSTVESDMALSSDFTVALNVDQDNAPGGTVTTNSAPGAGFKITITSVVASLQPVVLTNAGGFYPTVINGALDRLTIMAQQLAEQVSRAVKTSISSSTSPDDLLTDINTSVGEAASAAAAAQAAADAFGGETLAVEFGGTGADTAAGARAALGLGSAAVKTAGTGAGEVLLLAEAHKLPELNGENLTGVKAPACQGSMKNFLMSATGTNANVSVSFDELVIGDGANGYFTDRNVSDTINTALTGAGGLDTGALAINTFYSVWRIRKADGTRSWLLSLSETAPTMPTGYVQKARVGWIRTDGSANKYPLSFKQFGRNVQYVTASGSNVTDLPALVSGTQGNSTTPVFVAVGVASVVPSTASHITCVVLSYPSLITGLAPNPNYGAYSSATRAPFVVTSGSGVYGAVPVRMALESSNIYCHNDSSNLVKCMGWEDNI